MSKTKISTVIFTLAFLLASVRPAAAQNNGFVDLFNGVDLSGWENVNTAPETWTVRDSMIVCTGTPTGVLRTTKMYQNFVLELEWRHLYEGGNAGLFLHSGALPVTGRPFTRAIETQIMDGNGGDMFAIQGATLVQDNPDPTRGHMRSYPTEERMNPLGEWNHYRVVARDGVLTLAVNGAVVSRSFNNNPRRGYICLESEGSEIHFRNIRIRELDVTPIPPEVIARENEGFRSLYNGLDLRGWKMVAGNEGHWVADNWRLTYDGESTAEGESASLWTEEEFEDFELIVDWRLPRDPVVADRPVILPDGSIMTNEQGDVVTVPMLDAGDSGIYLRGTSKAQVNIWSSPVGSGEIYGYRTDDALPASVRRAATPIVRADNEPGQWNRFEIRLVGDVLNVKLNGQVVIRDAVLPGIPARGPIALQHHGDPVEFANVYIRSPYFQAP